MKRLHRKCADLLDSPFSRATRRTIIRVGQHLRDAPAPISFAAFAVICLAVFIVCDYVATSFLLIPLATFRFKTSHRTTALAVHHAWSDPSVKADVFIGATDARALPTNFTIDYATLPMQRPAADLIMSYLLPEDVYLEYGSGPTTLAFPHLVASTVSVTTNPDMCTTLQNQLHNQFKHLTVNSLCAPMSSSMHRDSRIGDKFLSMHHDGSYHDYEQFVELPIHSFPEHTFDKVLLNGNVRLACALRILSKLRPSSIVFFLNFFDRPDVHSVVLQYYHEVARIMPMPHATKTHNHHYQPGLFGVMVLAPKLRQEIDPHCSHLCHEIPTLTADDIHVVYNQFREASDDNIDIDNAFAFKYVPDTNSSGFPKEQLGRLRALQTSKDRLLLDLVALPVLFLAFKFCCHLYAKIYDRPTTNRPRR